MEIEKRDFSPEDGILCIGGSPRKGGNSDVILDTVSRRLEALDVPCEVIRLREWQISSCIGCEGCRKDHRCHGVKDDMQSLYPKIIAAKGLVLVSPTHHYNVTAWMKAFIDRMYCFYRFGNQVPRSWSSRLAGQGRFGVVIAVCEQKDKQDMGFTLEAMRLPMEAWGYRMVDEIAIFKVFKKAGILEVPDEMAKLVRGAEKIAQQWKIA